jgi:RNA polymerase sigma-70 factor (ECF subfamily)
MGDFSTTCWTAVRSAARGDASERGRFAERYEPVVRAYLAARWQRFGPGQDLDDALQEVFLECFKKGGALEAVAPGRPGGFRAFLHGVTRKVAARYEERRLKRREVGLDEAAAEVAGIASDEDLAAIFDRAWARAMVREAAVLQARHARSQGSEAEERVELLRLRFQEGLPVREIARRLGREPARVHHDYAKAREEFQLALREAVAFHMPGAETGLDRECERLLEVLKS